MTVCMEPCSFMFNCPKTFYLSMIGLTADEKPEGHLTVSKNRQADGLEGDRQMRTLLHGNENTKDSAVIWGHS